VNSIGPRASDDRSLTLDYNDVLATFALSRAQRTMGRLHMPLDSRWCEFKTPQPIAPDGSFSWRIEWLAATRPSRVVYTNASVLAPTWAPWHGYRVRGFGILPDPDAPPAGPEWTFVLPDPALRIQPWEIRVHPPGSMLFAELQWRPGYADARPVISGWKPGYRQSHLKAAEHGLELLFKLSPASGGRPRGTLKGQVWKREDYIAWWREAQFGYGLRENPHLRDLGDAMGVSADTAGARLRNLKPPLHWPPRSFPDEWEPESDD
jgi:hypothetical protein